MGQFPSNPVPSSHRWTRGAHASLRGLGFPTQVQVQKTSNRDQKDGSREDGGVERELTMEGVRRISCRPRPPRMTVLPVSMMTTLESRKPMLLIAHEREPRNGQTRTGLGFPWRVHTHTQ